MNKTLANIAGNSEDALVKLGDLLNLNTGIKTSDADILTSLNKKFRGDNNTLMHIQTAYNYYV